MDISRLPVAPYARPTTIPVRANHQPASPEAVEPVEGVTPRQRIRQTFEHVVQGELLHRERHSLYQSTRAFISERNLEQARPAGQQPDPLQQARSAISRYMQNTQPEAAADSSPGHSVNFFV